MLLGFYYLYRRQLQMESRTIAQLIQRTSGHFVGNEPRRKYEVQENTPMRFNVDIMGPGITFAYTRFCVACYVALRLIQMVV